MAKPKAPRWLTTAFAEGVVELAPPRPAPAYPGALGRCFLAQHDDRRRPCAGRLERIHVISRQRVENAMYGLLPDPALETVTMLHPTQTRDEVAAELGDVDAWHRWHDELILLAAWDPRNGGVACEGHHRRFDSHVTPTLIVHAFDLPEHVIEFAFDYGIEGQLGKFPGAADLRDPSPDPSRS